MFLDPRLRRLTTYLYVQDLLGGAEVLDLGGDAGDLLQARGARSVRTVSLAQLEALPVGQFDVAFALDLGPADLASTAAALRRAVKPEGVVVLSVPSRDRPGAQDGMSYYELSDLLEPLFPALTMVGQAPFAGATLVEYGVAEPDPMLDGTLVSRGERVGWYVAICGPKRAVSRGYGVIQVPIEELALAPAKAGRRASAPAPLEPTRAAPPAPKPAPAAAAPLPGLVELKEQLAAAQKGKAELLDFVHELQGQLAEREAWAAEHEGERRELSKLREAVRLGEARARLAEEAERHTRKKLAEAEGLVVRLRAGGAVPAELAAPLPDLAALTAELEKWKQKEADARADAWKALKARADAEAQAAEVREDTVRKLKDARKLASVELTRATEEAMKKAVTLKEELARTERERKELAAELKRLQAERAAAPVEQAAPPVEGEGEGVRGRVAALERELMNADAIAAADRARAAQLLADLEREAKERSEGLVRLRHALRDREREVTALRHELSERDARLTALEQRTAPSDEVERLEAELSTARTRLEVVTQELARKEALVERAAAAAAHERTRVERMVNDERRALDELNEVRARAVDAERRLEVARERLGRLELELRGETERVGALEQATRRAAEAVRNGHGPSTPEG